MASHNTDQLELNWQKSKLRFLKKMWYNGQDQKVVQRPLKIEEEYHFIAFKVNWLIHTFVFKLCQLFSRTKNSNTQEPAVHNFFWWNQFLFNHSPEEPSVTLQLKQWTEKLSSFTYCWIIGFWWPPGWQSRICHQFSNNQKSNIMWNFCISATSHRKSTKIFRDKNRS